MTWGFVWLMLALKIPLAALIYLVWWAVKQDPDQRPDSDDDGGHQAPPAPQPSAQAVSRVTRAAARTAIRLPRRPPACALSRRAPGRSATDRTRSWIRSY